MNRAKQDLDAASVASQAQQARAKRETALLDALKEIDARMHIAIDAHLTAAEAYDSFYQHLAQDAIKQATGDTP